MVELPEFTERDPEKKSVALRSIFGIYRVFVPGTREGSHRITYLVISNDLTEGNIPMTLNIYKFIASLTSRRE